MTKEQELGKRIWLAWGEMDAPTEKQKAIMAARVALGRDDTGRRDLLFEALCSALGADWHDMPKHEAAKYNVAAKQLRDIGADASEIIRRARRYETLHPDWELTPTSLITHWSTLKGGSASTRVADRMADHHAVVDEPEPTDLVGPPEEFLAVLRGGLKQMPEVD